MLRPRPRRSRRTTHLAAGAASKSQGLLTKIFFFTEIRNWRMCPCISPGTRDGSRVVRYVGELRWTRLASARKGREQGERRIEPNLVSYRPRVTNGASGVRQNRVVLTVVATVKPCEDGIGPTGPDRQLFAR